ncbi:hypothetical protein Gogos_014001 [Gossypium gossypioides]|uniref:Uncharacterized protein n=1 Tax=Gossypium gossypioides TaxID=34282 RepID=A0A7J9BXL7_GOSGO|nr:hypothetical protein [Gossypium gossypioides]
MRRLVMGLLRCSYAGGASNFLLCVVVAG